MFLKRISEIIDDTLTRTLIFYQAVFMFIYSSGISCLGEIFYECSTFQASLVYPV